MKRILLPVFAVLSFTQVFAQMYKCGHTHYEHYLNNKYGILPIRPEEVNTSSSRGGAVYEIPVVVHIVYNNAAENLSDELIRGQIDILNQDFRRLNADAGNTREIFKNVAADAMIQFYLAETDPDGKPTTGITRTQTSKESFIEFELDPLTILQAALLCGIDLSNPNPTDEQIICITEFLTENGFDPDELIAQLDNIKYSDKGGIDPWDQKRYLNIWVGDVSLNLLDMPTPFVLGYAYPPVGAPLFPPGSLPEGYEKNDGVVIHYQAFGKNNPNAGEIAATNSSGRTCVHEVGHYLGLRHIWGDGDCTVDDGIADTPEMESESQVEGFTNCSELLTKNTCTDGANDLPDMFENYMDYSPESCQNLFTQQQVNMMRAMLEGPRAELVGLNASTSDIAYTANAVYPNPTNGRVSFKNAERQAIIKIYDVKGQCILSGTNVTSLDLSGYNRGLYFYTLSQGGMVETGKIIKE